MGSRNITDIFNKDAFIYANDYPSLEALLERVKELDQDDTKYLEMLRQPILVDPEYPKRMDEELEKFILHIFEQPIEKAYRRSRVYYAKENNDYLARAIEPNLEHKVKRFVKKVLVK